MTPAGTTITAGGSVTFRENAGHPEVQATVTRVWENGKYVTLRTADARTFTRLITEVRAA